ncbi:MAG: imidazole glycerol phosphate synthase subunit HisH [Candidatus Caenarcaniphilales bacterium]|nr:imidazole glycerol phosphate synthase subunit HisH [Candidatus Caenarcaniphilales bacterium]
MSKSKPKVSIVKSKYANLYSVANALSAIGVEAQITDDRKEILSADSLICPGVGSFSQVKSYFDSHKLTDSISEFINTSKPFLGICVGMQILFEKGYEGKQPTKGLAFFEGEVVSLPPNKVSRIPHIGWNTLSFKPLNNKKALFNSFNESAEDVYFVHSFYCSAKNKKDILASAQLAENFEIPAIIGKNNIYGMQFHPERSGKVGLQLLKAFVSLSSEHSENPSQNIKEFKID